MKKLWRYISIFCYLNQWKVLTFSYLNSNTHFYNIYLDLEPNCKHCSSMIYFNICKTSLTHYFSFQKVSAYFTLMLPGYSCPLKRIAFYFSFSWLWRIFRTYKHLNFIEFLFMKNVYLYIYTIFLPCAPVEFYLFSKMGLHI